MHVCVCVCCFWINDGVYLWATTQSNWSGRQKPLAKYKQPQNTPENNRTRGPFWLW